MSDPYATLYTIARIYDIGNQFLTARAPRPTGYQRYLDDLYGHPVSDRFMVLNYAMLACMVVLSVVVLLAVGK